MNDDIKKVHPFDSFTAAYKILGWAGYYRPLNIPTSGYKWVLYQIYRSVIYLFLIIYNVQHLIFIAQNFDDKNKLMDCLMLEVSDINLLMKISALYFQTTRIDKLNNFLRDDLAFRVSDKDGQSILQKNKEEMHRLCRLLMIIVTFPGVLWPGSFFVKRYYDPKAVVPVYVPYATDTWTKFSFSVLNECSPLPWVCHGHLSMDALISTYYAHAHTQLKIIKQQLEHFAGEEENRCYLNNYFQYRDLVDENVGKRFVLIVKRYEKLVWYKKEIGEIFNVPLVIQFFTSTSSVCLVVYNMTLVRIISFQFVFLLVLFINLQAQVFIFCYYGNLLEFESHNVNTSLYNSDWLSLSPAFRRQMLVAMQQWSRPLQARVCYIIPLSLATFITIVKSSYRLYTVLVTTKHNDV